MEGMNERGEGPVLKMECPWYRTVWDETPKISAASLTVYMRIPSYESTG